MYTIQKSSKDDYGNVVFYAYSYHNSLSEAQEQIKEIANDEERKGHVTETTQDELQCMFYLDGYWRWFYQIVEQHKLFYKGDNRES